MEACGSVPPSRRRADSHTDCYSFPDTYILTDNDSQQDAYIDERMDPVKATQAGCRYLQNLYNMFGDWELAMSAYNCGPGKVR